MPKARDASGKLTEQSSKTGRGQAGRARSGERMAKETRGIRGFDAVVEPEARTCPHTAQGRVQLTLQLGPWRGEQTRDRGSFSDAGNSLHVEEGRQVPARRQQAGWASEWRLSGRDTSARVTGAAATS